jgi:hypothetical protein
MFEEFGYRVDELFALLRAPRFTIPRMGHAGALQAIDEFRPEQIGITVYNFVAQRRIPPAS